MTAGPSPCSATCIRMPLVWTNRWATALDEATLDPPLICGGLARGHDSLQVHGCHELGYGRAARDHAEKPARFLGATGDRRQQRDGLRRWRLKGHLLQGY